ncbi:hypothetical protein ACVXZ4_05625 [Lacisediminihabitans sp. FW035]
MRSKLVTLVAIVASTLIMALGAAAPASAATGDVLLSRDGITFASDLGGGLFDGAGALIPGETVSRSLWIRNPSSSPAAFRVSIRNLASTSADLANGIDLSWIDSLPGTARSSFSLSGLKACQVMSSAAAIAPGGTVKLSLTLTMADLVSTVAQSERASIDIMVAMRDAAAGSFSGSACGDGGTLLADTGTFRTVAFTGGTLPVPLIVGGGVLLGVGMCLIVARRRRQSEDD